MRTLLITRNFPPLLGGMERLNEKLFACLQAHDPTSLLVGPVGASRFVPPGTAVAEIPARPLPAAVTGGVARAIACAHRARPEVVLAGSGLMAPAAVMAAGAVGAMAAVYLHGLDIVAPSRVYRAVWWPFIRRCRVVMVNSRNTRRLAIEAGIAPERIRVVHPGTTLPPVDAAARSRFRTRLGIAPHAPVLLSVGRLTERKGLAEFVMHALPIILRSRRETRLLIIGDTPTDALHPGRGAGRARVEAAAAAAGVGDAVHWLGHCSDAALSDAYHGADVHVFPIREIPSDVEGFGMVAIEAAAHGLATVAFDVGGVGDAVCTTRSGTLVEAGNHAAFARAVVDLLAAPGPVARSESARAFAQGYSWDRFGREVIEALLASGAAR